jgi:hypothetical protein
MHLHLSGFVLVLYADAANYRQSIDAEQESRFGLLVYGPMADLSDGGQQSRISRS